MTDNDIIKALEWHLSNERDCTPCPYGKTSNTYSCVETLIKDGFNLINRQKAEIERYKGVIKLLENDVQTAKVEAVKEFAERLKTETFLAKAKGSVEHVLWIDEIDNLVKGMTEVSEK